MSFDTVTTPGLNRILERKIIPEVQRIAEALEALARCKPGASIEVQLDKLVERPEAERIQLAVDRLADAGLVVSFCFGPMRGEPTPLWSVTVLDTKSGGEFERPYAATSIEQAAQIAALEARARGWIQ